MSGLQIHTSQETERGCGFRKTGKDGFGLYLVAEPYGEPCERLPFPLTVCPCCGAGIKFGRGLCQVDASKLFALDTGPRCTRHEPTIREFLYGPRDEHRHEACWLCNPGRAESAWILWVGRENYTPASFAAEAARMGVSKRIGALPRNFVLGESVVYLAHLDAVPPWSEWHPEHGEEEAPKKAAAGVFMVYRPRLEVVVDTTSVEDLPPYARELAERHPEQVRLVKVEPVTDEQLALEGVAA